MFCVKVSCFLFLFPVYFFLLGKRSKGGICDALISLKPVLQDKRDCAYLMLRHAFLQ